MESLEAVVENVSKLWGTANDERMSLCETHSTKVPLLRTNYFDNSFSHLTQILVPFLEPGFDIW